MEVSVLSTLSRRNFKTEGLLRERIQCFPSALSLEGCKNATITGYFGFVFEKTELGQGNHVIIESHDY